MGDQTQGITITPPPAEVTVSVGTPTIWVSDNFAPDWFADALHEAQQGKDHNAVRREIIFASCFVESYIFEWTRQKVQINELERYFPANPKRWRSPVEKWKTIPTELYKAGKIPADPKLDLSKLGTLIEYRNGLVHARASRPATDRQPSETRPYPTKTMLKGLQPGWAVKIVLELVTALHQATGDPIPAYIVKL